MPSQQGWRRSVVWVSSEQPKRAAVAQLRQASLPVLRHVQWKHCRAARLPSSQPHTRRPSRTSSSRAPCRRQVFSKQTLQTARLSTKQPANRCMGRKTRTVLFLTNYYGRLKHARALTPAAAPAPTSLHSSWSCGCLTHAAASSARSRAACLPPALRPAAAPFVRPTCART